MIYKLRLASSDDKNDVYIGEMIQLQFHLPKNNYCNCIIKNGLKTTRDSPLIAFTGNVGMVRLIYESVWITAEISIHLDPSFRGKIFLVK